GTWRQHPGPRLAATSAVIDPAAWRQAVPRFQSHHTDSLIGPWPEAADTYRQRSVLHQASRIRHRVLLIHGTADQITPVAQAEQLAAFLHRTGRPCTLILLPGEGHTLGAAANIRAALHAELDHYQRTFEAGPHQDYRLS